MEALLLECLDENRLLAFFEKRLDEDATRGVDIHLAACSTCRQLLAAYAAMAGPVNATAPLYGAEPATASVKEAVPAELAEHDRAHLGRRIALAVAEKRVGTVLSGKWHIDSLLGVGGMAYVYDARHRNGRPAAVKVLRPELAVEPLFVQRFLREGYLANKVLHPGAVAVLDDDMTPEGSPFLVMERLVGRTLGERLAADGPLPADDALRIAFEVLDVLAAAHARGIVHRDIKPDNLFETQGGPIKVLDFGIARLHERTVSGGPNTHTGFMMGTLGFMAPEQAKGLSDEIDARSDIWAVGASLYTLLTGRTLHEAPSTNAGLLRAMTERVAPMRELAPSLPPRVAALLDRALAFDKSARFSGSREMADAVVRARQSPGQATPDVRPRAVRWVSLATLGGALILVAGFVSTRKPASDETTSAGSAVSPQAAVPAKPPADEWSPVPTASADKSADPFSAPPTTSSTARGSAGRRPPPISRPAATLDPLAPRH